MVAQVQSYWWTFTLTVTQLDLDGSDATPLHLVQKRLLVKFWAEDTGTNTTSS